MTRHERARVARILICAHRPTESLRDCNPLLSVKPCHGKSQQLFSGLIELANVTPCGLPFFTPQVSFAQLRKHRSVSNRRSTSARIIRQPSTVVGPNQV